jgi:hypothetical protein
MNLDKAMTFAGTNYRGISLRLCALAVGFSPPRRKDAKKKRDSAWQSRYKAKVLKAF